ncbi:hypothetical protein HHK36_014394 [Tetracentron sinense]|uniref:Uncharacterized protein n=1 Tax=Tetracentron sinense TaxID=13715 RepID=A0A834ZC56_TETSI|nr:hypothetical protein HHK36_014394 [Tetracentron sinense]
MLVAFESSSNRIEGSRFMGGMPCISILDSPEPGMSIPGVLAVDRRLPVGNNNMATTSTKIEEELDSCSSSIGRNSDFSGSSSEGDDSGETEVQSSFKGPFDTMDSLEEVLPIRRGISKFYRGKSKSFTSLAVASSSSSIRDIAKPDNSYTRKRKNLLACSNIWDKNRNWPLRSNGGGISKRPANSSRSTLALAVAMSSSESNNASENSNQNSPSPPRHLPPLHPLVKPLINNTSSVLPPQRNFSPCRSFSLTDLQCAAAATNNMTRFYISNRDQHKKLQ